jgi:hypothetical protein
MLGPAEKSLRPSPQTCRSAGVSMPGPAPSEVTAHSGFQTCAGGAGYDPPSPLSLSQR